MTDDTEGVYDPAEHDEVLTMENVSLMPNWMGVDKLRVIVLLSVCIAFLVPPALMFMVLPWQIALGPLIAAISFDFWLLVALTIARAVTPDHETLWQFLKSRRDERLGRETIRSDPTLPSRRDR